MESTETDAWQAHAIAAMLRDTFAAKGGDSAAGVRLSADDAMVLAIGLNRLAELTKIVAKAEV